LKLIDNIVSGFVPETIFYMTHQVKSVHDIKFNL